MIILFITKTKGMEFEIIVPAIELSKYLSQYEVYALSLVSKGIREKYHYMYERFKQFFTTRANKINLSYGEDSFIYGYIFTDYSSGKKITIKKKIENINICCSCFTCISNVISELNINEPFQIKFGDIIKYKINYRNKHKTIIKNLSFYADNILIYNNGNGLNYQNPDLFPLYRFSHLHWMRATDKFTIDINKSVFYFDRDNYLDNIEINMNDFKYRIYCSPGVVYINEMKHPYATIKIEKDKKGKYRITQIVCWRSIGKIE